MFTMNKHFHPRSCAPITNYSTVYTIISFCGGFLLGVGVIAGKHCISGEVSTEHLVLVLQSARVGGGPSEMEAGQLSRKLKGRLAGLKTTLLLLEPAFCDGSLD